MAVLSLVFLLAAIGLGFFRKTNMGIVAFGMCLILGKISGLSVKVLQSGFPTKLFITLLGVMLLFSIAQENKTLEQIARRIISLAGKHVYLIPIVVYVFSTILAAVGPGTVPVMSIMAVFTCSLAAEMKISPLLLSATSVLGAAAGGCTPIAATGILGASLAEQQGITGIAFPLEMNILMAMTVYFIVIYFVLGGYKMKADVDYKTAELPSYSKEQFITMIGMGLMVIAVIFFKSDVGFTSFTVAAALLLLKVADQKQAISHIPWGTLFMIAGINTLMAMVIKLKGIALLAAGLAAIMTPFTAPGIMGLTAGIMSFFSSTSGVVMPTLIPTVSDVAVKVGGVSAISLISAIVNTASAAGMSPISTGGSMGLAAYSQVANASAEEQSKLFVRLFAVAIGGVIVIAMFAMTGAYNIFA